MTSTSASYLPLAKPMVYSRRIELHPFVASGPARDWLHRLVTDPILARPFRWRYANLSEGDLMADVLSGQLLTCIVVGRSSRLPLGAVFLTAADLRDGHASVSVLAAWKALGTGLTVEGTMALIHLAFLEWPFRKVYADVDTDSLRRFASVVDRYAEIEGRFRSHVYRDGHYLDVLRLALYRESWSEHCARFSKVFTIPGTGSSTGGGARDATQTRAK